MIFHFAAYEFEEKEKIIKTTINMVLTVFVPINL